MATNGPQKAAYQKPTAQAFKKKITHKSAVATGGGSTAPAAPVTPSAPAPTPVTPATPATPAGTNTNPNVQPTAVSPTVASTPVGAPGGDTGVSAPPASGGSQGAPVPDSSSLVPGTPDPNKTDAKDAVSETVPGAGGPEDLTQMATRTPGPGATASGTTPPQLGTNADPGANTATLSTIENLINNRQPTGNTVLDSAIDTVLNNYKNDLMNPPVRSGDMIRASTTNPSEFQGGGDQTPDWIKEKSATAASEAEYADKNKINENPNYVEGEGDGQGGFNPFLDSIPARTEMPKEVSDVAKKRKITNTGTSAVSSVVSGRTPALGGYQDQLLDEEGKFNPYTDSIG